MLAKGGLCCNLIPDRMPPIVRGSSTRSADRRTGNGRTILTRKPLSCRRFGACSERLGPLAGGESVSQLPLKDKALLTFSGQNPPFELRPKTGISPTGPTLSISVAGGQQGWLAFVLRRQRSHVRIVSSGAPQNQLLGVNGLK